MPLILTHTIFLLTLAILSSQTMAQEQTPAQITHDSYPAYNCSQPASERDAMIREAEQGRYTTRRVEFTGNTYTRDSVLRRRITLGLQEGDLFTRWNLVRSLRNVSRLKIIYPVGLKDVELHLNRSEKHVDMTICFKERGRRARPKR